MCICYLNINLSVPNTYSLQMECKESVCGPQLTNLNMLLCNSHLQLAKMLSSVSSYLCLITKGQLSTGVQTSMCMKFALQKFTYRGNWQYSYKQYFNVCGEVEWWIQRCSCINERYMLSRICIVMCIGVKCNRHLFC